MEEKEYEIKFKLNGKSENYYVTVSIANITPKELRDSIISRTN